MLVVISPAKRLDLNPVDGITPTLPKFQADANRLAGHARQLGVQGLEKLMDISRDLAVLNRDRFRDFRDEADPDQDKPAVLAFAGDTYTGLEASSLDVDELNWAQDHLRILSGLYGVLRPLDAIQPYRLEMGSRLKTRRGTNLYDYWRDAPAKTLKAQADEVGTDTLINCASQEYFGAVDEKKLGLRVITPVFMEMKPKGPKIVSFFAKKARGSMARFIIQRRLSEPEGIKDFDLGGYSYQPDMSEADKWVFLRDQESSDAS
ncbi:MAG: peroxide stress protein YaaA [Brevirhabdus sp.]